MENLIPWLEEQLKKRGWRPADLARAANLPDATISNILNQNRKAGPEVCRAIASGLDLDEEEVFRHAGLLSPVPPAVAEEREAVRILRRLSPEFRTVAINVLRAIQQPDVRLLPPPPRHSLAEPGTAYQAPPNSHQVLLELWDQSPGWLRSNFIESLRSAIDQMEQTGDLEQEIDIFLAEYPELHDIIEEAQNKLSEQAIRALLLNIRIFTTQRDERDRFSQLHQQLSHLFAQLAS